MSFDVEEFVLYQIANAEVRRYPFPHFFVSPVFPQGYYDELQQRLPPSQWYRPIDDTESVRLLDGAATASAYPERFISELADIEEREAKEGDGSFWQRTSEWLMSDRFRGSILEKFRPDMAQRFGAKTMVKTDIDARLVRDFTRYAIGPHTDSPNKLVSLLFYLPKDSSLSHLGTSIYAPVDPAFRCSGGPHHKFKKFKKVASMPYVPNSLFVFFKTDYSFHGVDQILDAGIERNLLLYNIYVRAIARRASGLPWPWRMRQTWMVYKDA